MRKERIKRKIGYKVDERNRCVICTLECDLELRNHPAWNSIQEEFFNKSFPYIDWRGQFTVKAKARCGESDVFDERKGRDIALGRAEAKMYRTASRVYRLCALGLERLGRECVKSSMMCASNSIDRADDVNNLING